MFCHSSSAVIEAVQELSKGDQHIVQFYAEVFAARESYCADLVDSLPKVKDRVIDLYRLYQSVQQLGGYSNLLSMEPGQQSAFLGCDPSDVHCFVEAYQKFLLIVEELQHQRQVSEESLKLARCFESQKAYLASNEPLIYDSMHIPAARTQQSPAVYAGIRGYQYNEIPFGALPVLQPEVFDVETVTGKLEFDNQPQYLDTINQTTDILELCNYMVLMPSVFLRSQKTQELLIKLTSGQMSLREQVVFADSLSQVIGMFFVPASLLLFRCCSLQQVCQQIFGMCNEFPRAIEILIRVLASCICASPENSALVELIQQYYEPIKQLALHFARSTKKSPSGLYTFTAAITLIRCLIMQQFNDELVYVAIDIAQQLIVGQDDYCCRAMHSISELLLDLLDTQLYDNVLVFMSDNREKFDDAIQARIIIQ